MIKFSPHSIVAIIKMIKIKLNIDILFFCIFKKRIFLEIKIICFSLLNKHIWLGCIFLLRRILIIIIELLVVSPCFMMCWCFFRMIRIEIILFFIYQRIIWERFIRNLKIINLGLFEIYWSYFLFKLFHKIFVWFC